MSEIGVIYFGKEVEQNFLHQTWKEDHQDKRFYRALEGR